MKLLKQLKDTMDFHDDEGNIVARKGTTCDLMAVGPERFVKKQWHSGDWVFDAEYEYAIEKHIYTDGNEAGLPIPRMVDFNDEDRSLLLEFVEGEYVETPCDDTSLLSDVVSFHDQYKGLGFPEKVAPILMDGDLIHNYRLEQLQYIFGAGQLCDTFDSIYESMLQGIGHAAIPFDRILHNTLNTNNGLCFYDFEWTVAGPYEFTLARIAVEFKAVDNQHILERVEFDELYQLFLIRFYLYGREPNILEPYLSETVCDQRLCSLLELIRAHQQNSGLQE